jgi:hypothetical protein
MKTRKPFTLAGVAALALTTGLVVAANPSQAAATKSYAYGFSLGGEEGQPRAEHPGGPSSDGGRLPDDFGPLAAGGVLTVEASENQARATVTNLTLGGGMAQLPAELRTGLQELYQICEGMPEEADGGEDPVGELLGNVPGGLKDTIKTPEDLRDACEALGGGDFAQLASIRVLDAECKGQNRTVKVQEARVFGSDQALTDSDVSPNTSLLPPELAPLIKITLNKQYTNDKGGSVVEGLVLELGGEEVGVLASATCGERIPAEKSPGRAPAPPRAEAPEPVRQSVPVTG